MSKLCYSRGKPMRTSTKQFLGTISGDLAIYCWEQNAQKHLPGVFFMEKNFLLHSKA